MSGWAVGEGGLIVFRHANAPFQCSLRPLRLDWPGLQPVLVPETLPFARLLLIQEIWHAYKHLDRRLGETSNTSARFHAGSSLGRTGGQGLDLGLLADAYDASRHPDVVQGGQAANSVYRCVVGASG